jgi:hypothetical protein
LPTSTSRNTSELKRFTPKGFGAGGGGGGGGGSSLEELVSLVVLEGFSALAGLFDFVGFSFRVWLKAGDAASSVMMSKNKVSFIKALPDESSKDIFWRQKRVWKIRSPVYKNSVPIYKRGISKGSVSNKFTKLLCDGVNSQRLN